jgi:putative transposase
MPLAMELAPRYGVQLVAEAMGLSAATLWRRFRPPAPKGQRPSPHSVLTAAEEQAILDVLHGERFVDVAPAEVVATLLDEGVYLGSTRTFYRILEKHQEIKERRNQMAHPKREVPRLLATGSNQVWSWDITKLKGPNPWEYFYLYVILDIYSRYVVGWMLGRRETAELAKRLVEQAYENQGLGKDTGLKLHSDLGAPMKAKPFIALTAKLGIANSFSRPRVSDDNPYIESHFRTLKYRPDFPGRFGSYEDCEAHCQRFFGWYNQQHRHSGIAYLTPEDVHYNRAEAVIAQRQQVLDQAKRDRPERFIKGPIHPPLPKQVWINNPTKAAPPVIQAA